MKRDTIEAAKRLGLSPKTLENWRCLGKGPAFLKVGAKILYDDADLDAFEASCRRTSTSQRSAAQ